ncbi:MAG: methylenetetrahydrofolate reductase [NAD(P)H] [Elusimicrobia bacterium]|nr:methylenetetrahydrofolate reductase [NAD(P)H] [Elusimicrobiota bacterium]
MRIAHLLKNHKKSFSFEFFPPKSDEDVDQLLKTAESLKTLNPTFISVTWGAGGSTRRKTIDIVCAIKNQLNVESMAHLTCVGASQEELGAILNEFARRGIENILALRGDPPRGETRFVPHPDGFRHADELVTHIRRGWTFCVGVAGYPEGHVECADKKKDLENLKHKVDTGADFVITQLFFDNADYFSFVERARAMGVSIPIIPGIMPITNVNQIKRFSSGCGAKIPPSLLERLEPVQDNSDAVVQAGIDHATRQCEDLLRQGAPGIHFYTLNRSRSTAEILKNLRPASL